MGFSTTTTNITITIFKVFVVIQRKFVIIVNIVCVQASSVSCGRPMCNRKDVSAEFLVVFIADVVIIVIVVIIAIIVIIVVIPIKFIRMLSSVTSGLSIRGDG